MTYTVQPGDSLWEIATRFYGDADAVSSVAEANKGRQMPDGRTFDTAALIRPGWVLVLPQPMSAIEDQRGTSWYTVQRADSLASISARLLGDARRWPQLYQLNREVVARPAIVLPGQRLRLPGTDLDTSVDPLGQPPETADDPILQGQPPAEPTGAGTSTLYRHPPAGPTGSTPQPARQSVVTPAAPLSMNIATACDPAGGNLCPR